jgi:hypothetical protein
MTPEQRQSLEQEAIKTGEEIAQLIRNAQSVQAQYAEQLAQLQLKQSAFLAAVDIVELTEAVGDGVVQEESQQ